MSKMTIGELHKKIAAVAPIDGVSCGKADDKATWTIGYQDTASDAEKTAAQAIIAAAPIPLVMTHKTISVAEFFDRLTEDELAAVDASTDAEIAKWRRRMQYCSIVELDSEACETEMAYLVSLGILTEARVAEILS